MFGENNVLKNCPFSGKWKMVKALEYSIAALNTHRLSEALTIKRKLPFTMMKVDKNRAILTFEDGSRCTFYRNECIFELLPKIKQ